MRMTYHGVRIHDALNKCTSWSAVTSFVPGAKPEEQHQ
jgi:hypothetical protein